MPILPEQTIPREDTWNSLQPSLPDGYLARFLPQVTDQVIKEMLQEVEEIRHLRFNRDKEERLQHVVQRMSPVHLWLFTFSVWCCLFNPRLRFINPSYYYSIDGVSKSNGRRFTEFLELLQARAMQRPAARKDAELTEFLSRCTPLYRSYYLSLLSGRFVQGFPLDALRSTLPVDQINIEEIYGELPMPASSSLPCPTTMVGALDRSEEAYKVRISRGGNQVSAQMFSAGDWVEWKMSPALQRDLRYLNEASISLLGLWAPRLEKLLLLSAWSGEEEVGARATLSRRVQQHNLWSALEPTTILAVEQRADIARALWHLAQHYTGVYIVPDPRKYPEKVQWLDLSRRVTTRFESVVYEEVTGRYFIECWLNGDIVRAHYGGAEQRALAANLKRLRGSGVELLRIPFDDEPMYIVTNLLWPQKPWRTRNYTNMHGHELFIEKCIFCGSTRWAHASSGLCHNCECHMHYVYKRNPVDPTTGVGEWFGETPAIAAARTASMWEPKLLNRAWYHYQGRRLVARKDGMCRFQEDTACMDFYQSNQKKWRKMQGAATEQARKERKIQKQTTRRPTTETASPRKGEQAVW
jgi:hypothetical protein